ncbi:MAG: DNA topoisomerase [Betaproteobacteria bacterium 13_1_40CM_4_64_4]|nr:MAG: DNA topoisomerase [Betaproteobacteria bacterium 13_1_40CM_4_64_4]
MVRDTTNNGAESASDTVAEAVEMAAAAGLVYVSDSQPGIRRERNGGQFIYFRANRRRVTQANELERIARLAIPPAYEDVWICAHPRGHLQATGRDARRRKQYRYHPEWRTIRDGAKFGSMAEFGEALPRLRARVRRDLALPGLPREKVLAVVVSLLDATCIRVGNAEYAKANASYGLTTLRNRHVRFIRAGRLLFRFRGKGGAEHEVVVDDERLARIVRRCQQLPGQRLFQYVDDAGQRRGIDSGQVNEYLGDAMGADFTAKDFRTWSATVRAIALLRATPLPQAPSERALNACIVAVVKTIAAELRNTPAVCRKSYINPCVFEAWRSGELHAAIGADVSIAPRKAERLALEFLQRRSKAAASPRTLRRRRSLELFREARSPG